MANDPNERRKFQRPRQPVEVQEGSAVEMYRDIDPNVLQRCVMAAARAGGAVRFGSTRDGGAVAVGVYHGDEYFTDYIRPSENFEDYLRDLTSSFDVAGKPDLRPKGNKRPK